MNKKLMALAVAGALAAPATALAQVQISGSIHLQYFQHDPGSPAAQKGDILETTEPNLVVRGEEKLGGGLSAWFQCESTFDVVGTEQSGFCGRNSAIGFRGGFGNIFAGNWDTPHKMAVSPHRGWFGLNNVFARATVLWNGAPSNVTNGLAGVGTGSGSSTASASGFSRRQAQSWNYHSPDFGGLSFQAQFSARNESTSLPDASPLKPRLMSFGGRFGTGPLLITAGYEKHDDFVPDNNPATYTGGSDTSWVVGVGYTFAGAIKLSGVYTKNEWENTGAAATGTVENDGFAVWLDWRLSGPHSIKLQYVKLNDADGTAGQAVGNATVGDGTGGEVTTFVYAYDFSKRTQLYFAYNRTQNDDNVANAVTLGQTATVLGGTQKAFGLGVRHSF